MMSTSLFFDYPCKRDGSEEREVVTELAWCKSENLLACALESGRVAIYQDEGNEMGAASIARENQQRVSVMDWSPRGRLLVIGWMDGQVSTWNVMDTLQENLSICACSNQGVHKKPLTVMMWNPSGTRLITGDKAGVMCVWKADARGNVAPSVQYRRKGGAITVAVFCGGPLYSPDAFAQALSPSFFFATEDGTVCYADDLGHCSEVQQLTSAVDKLVFYEEARRLVIITRSLLMTQLQVGEDGRVSQCMKVKLSVSASSVRESGLHEVTWAGPGLLAAATGEGLVRFWDLSSDKNYVLMLQSGGLDRSDKAVSIGFDPVRRYLAVGSRYGFVAIWKFVGTYETAVVEPSADQGERSADKGTAGALRYAKGRERRQQETAVRPTSAGDKGGPNDWKALAPVALDSAAVGVVRWGATGGVLGAIGLGMANGAHVLAETVLHRQLSGNVAAVQLTCDTLSIEYQKGSGIGGVTLGTGDVLEADVDGGGSAVEGEQTVRCDINVKGFHLQGGSLLVYNNKQAQLVKLRGPGLPPQKGDPWACAARSVAVDDARDQAFLATGSGVEICNLKGGFKSALAFTEAEGDPMLLSLCGSFLAVATDKGSIKLYDVSKRGKIDHTSTLPVRPLGSAGSFVCAKTGKSLGLMRSIACNADGTRVSILSDRVHGQALKIRSPDSHLYVYGADKDSVESYDWGPEGRYPTAHYWDPTEPRLLAVEVRRLTTGDGAITSKRQIPRSGRQEGVDKSEGSEEEEGGGMYGGDFKAAAAARSSARARAASLGVSVACEAEVTTMFVTSDFGILMQDSFPLEDPLEALVGLQIPRLYFTARGSSNEKEDNEGTGDGDGDKKGAGRAARRPILMSRAMRDFVGLNQVDEKTSAALLDFSLHLTVGDMDKAHAAVRLIKSATVWENMAHMCVKTRRLDVAELCLGNMGHARGAAAVRLAKIEPEPEVAVAQVAVQLGLLDDAVRLYLECGRYDLLNRLYQAAGLWDRALEVAETHDEINLSTTHHLYAQHLEKVGDTRGAVRHYELAGTHCVEVPRMLFERERVEDLEEYITKGTNQELLRWWSKYLESRGELHKARRTYGRAQDYLSLVRLACRDGRVERAKDIVNESGSLPAAYHLARHFEAIGKTADAVSFYARSSRFNHAIRLAKDHGMDAELMGFALKSRPSLMISVAEYFEEKDELERAVQLFQKAGEVNRALELCFKAGEGGRDGGEKGVKGETRPAVFEALKAMADDLGAAASPEVLTRCVDFFIDNGQFEKAVSLCITNRRYLRAIELCVEHKVPISEEMAEELTPPKGEDTNRDEGGNQGGRSSQRSSGGGSGGQGESKGTEAAECSREKMLAELAKACKRQGNFHLACKKYTQAGDRLKALKCLLKSGDTKSIVYYAGVSRSRDIYILAANYLQNLDWHDDPQVMKSIITFYTKARAHTQLADFYDACAQVEMDEYRDYEKALGALNEASKELKKAGGPAGDKLAQLNKRLCLVERFVQARRLAKDDPEGMVSIYQQLLVNEEQLETAIRAGDVFAALVDHFFERQDWQQCYSLVARMRDRGIALDPYLDHGVLVRVCEEVGVLIEELDPSHAASAQTGMPSEGEDEVGEDIPLEDDDIDSEGHTSGGHAGYK